MYGRSNALFHLDFLKKANDRFGVVASHTDRLIDKSYHQKMTWFNGSNYPR